MLTTLTETKDPAKAQAAIDKLTKLADEWALKLHNAEQEMKHLEATAGETVLASILQGNDGTKGIVTTLANARSQYAVAIKTLEAIEHNQSIAKANLKLARAHQLRQQAEAKGKERDAHMAKVNALLGQLQELDGARYVPFKPILYPGVYSDPVPYVVSRGEMMEREINGMLAQATELETSARSMLAKADAQHAKTVSHVHG